MSRLSYGYIITDCVTFISHLNSGKWITFQFQSCGVCNSLEMLSWPLNAEDSLIIFNLELCSKAIQTEELYFNEGTNRF